jgi:sulfate permease, SulP family
MELRHLNDRKEAIVNLTESCVTDLSAIETLNKLTERYLKKGKILHLLECYTQFT